MIGRIGGLFGNFSGPFLCDRKDMFRRDLEKP